MLTRETGTVAPPNIMQPGVNYVKYQFQRTFPVKHLDSFAGRLKAARNAMFERVGRDMTQSALADKAGVTRATVSGWESGLYEPPRRMMQKLADILGVTSVWLDYGQEPRYPAETVPLRDRLPITQKRGEKGRSRGE
jgi:DNA-binding XRE family transcriptional regulator